MFLVIDSIGICNLSCKQFLNLNFLSISYALKLNLFQVPEKQNLGNTLITVVYSLIQRLIYVLSVFGV